MIEKKASRRSFLGYAVTAVVVGVVAGVGGYYAGLLSAPPGPGVTTTIPGAERTTTVTTTKAGPGVPVTTTVTPPPVTKTVTTTVTTEPPMVEDREKIIEAAKKEGALVHYSTTFPATMTELIKGFNELYPFIEVTTYRAGAGSVTEKLMAEVTAGKINADIVGQTSDIPLSYYKREGVLTRYMPPEAAKNIPQTRERDGYWAADRMIFTGILYNTDMVAPEEVPKDWWDLLDPKNKGKTAGGTVAGGGQSQWTWYQVEVLGEKWLEGFGALQPKLFAGWSPIAMGVGSGEYRMTAMPAPLAVDYVIGKGIPAKFVVPPEVPVTWGSDAIVKGGPHPNAAKLWVSFVHSDYAQNVWRKVGYLIPVEDAAPFDAWEPLGIRPIDQVKFIYPDFDWIDEHFDELVATYQKYVQPTED